MQLSEFINQLQEQLDKLEDDIVIQKVIFNVKTDDKFY